MNIVLCQAWRQVAIIATLALLSGLPAAAQQQYPERKPGDDVKDARIREAAGLRPGKNLLFNGWGVTPAGEHVPISDLALKLVVSPDKKLLLAASAGFNNTGLSLLDIKSRRVTQFLPLQKIWNGLAFSLDGKRIFVSGGDSGRVHVFNYADGAGHPRRRPSSRRRRRGRCFWREWPCIPRPARSMFATKPMMRSGC